MTADGRKPLKKSKDIAMNNTDMKELVRKHSRRRHPKRHVFLKGMIIYSVLMLVVIAALICVGWKYASLRDDALPERAIEKMISRGDATYWKQLLLNELPKTYPAYEDGERLAREVLADRFSVGEVTYIKFTSRNTKDSPVFLLISDGKPMAEVTLRSPRDRLFGLGEWEIDSVSFRQSYFESEGVNFRKYTISVFEGAVLSINGTVIDRSTAQSGGAYPLLSKCEEARTADLPCDVYTLDGIYFDPQITATLNGETLELASAPDGSVTFAPSAGMVRTVSATVPTGVTVRFNGIKAADDWAELTHAEGASGELDMGGTGASQVLDVWTVEGLFFEPEVSAEYAGTTLSVLSHDGGKYVFNTPDECRFTLTVLAPRGAEVTVNGKKLTASPVAATLDDLRDSGTLPGIYGTDGFAPYSVTPAFDKYTVTGFLVHPVITASLGGSELPVAADRTEGYFITCSFDIPDTAVPDGGMTDPALAAAYEAASAFAEKYFLYISRGGDMGKNFAAFDAAYGEMLASLTRGTPAYQKLMEGYAAAYRAPSYTKAEFERFAATGYTTYADVCVSISAEYSLALSNPSPETTGEETSAEAAAPAEPDVTVISGTLRILLVRSGDTWSVMGFADQPAA